MSLFDKLVTLDTVESFGIDMSVWTEDMQASLYEGMVLAMKENPDWTEDEARHECRMQVLDILYGPEDPRCNACSTNDATMPNDFGPDDLGDRVCADCYWDLRKEFRHLRYISEQKSRHFHVFCQTCGEEVKACCSCEKRSGTYYMDHCKDCYDLLHTTGEPARAHSAKEAAVFLCSGCESSA
jgi:hypothetical protein